MLDIKVIRENPEAVKSRLKRRGGDFKEIDELLKPEEDRRSGLQESELLKNKKKKLSAEVGQLKQKGQDASKIMEEVKAINLSIKDLDDKIQTVSAFTGGGNTFQTTGFDPANNSILGGVELTFESINNFDFIVAYDIEAKEDFTSHSALLKGRWSF